MVVAQLVERMLATPEVYGSNPVISKHFTLTSYCQLYRKDENREKVAVIWPNLDFTRTKKYKIGECSD